jgi:hypothetical protein
MERMVALLAKGLTDAGYDVMVFASGDPRVDADVSCVSRRAPSWRIGEPLPELRQVLEVMADGEPEGLRERSGRQPHSSPGPACSCAGTASTGGEIELIDMQARHEDTPPPQQQPRDSDEGIGVAQTTAQPSEAILGSATRS